jgi:hypothetical protein
MSLSEVKQTERGELEAWDRQIESAFSVDGPGMKLLAEVDAEIAQGNFTPLPSPCLEG